MILGFRMGQPLRFRIHRKIRDYLGLFVRFDKKRGFNRYCAEKFGGQPVTGAEIGVARGENAEEILETLNVEKLYLIDPYPSEESKYHRAHTELNASGFGDQVEWITKTSDEAAQEIPGSLDFVYIDGLHTQDQVKKDLANYWPKIREGGVIGGHDAQIDEVFRAVWDFAANQDKRPKIRSTQQQFPDWIFDKD